MSTLLPKFCDELFALILQQSGWCLEHVIKHLSRLGLAHCFGSVNGLVDLLLALFEQLLLVAG